MARREADLGRTSLRRFYREIVIRGNLAPGKHAASHTVEHAPQMPSTSQNHHPAVKSVWIS